MPALTHRSRTGPKTSRQPSSNGTFCKKELRSARDALRSMTKGVTSITEVNYDQRGVEKPYLVVYFESEVAMQETWSNPDRAAREGAPGQYVPERFRDLRVERRVKPRPQLVHQQIVDKADEEAPATAKVRAAS